MLSFGKFCPNCGRESVLPMDVRCRNLKDKAGHLIDVERIAGVYLSVSELKGFFKRCTNYTKEEAEELAAYIYEYIDGYEYGVFAAAAERHKIEEEAKPYVPPRVPDSLGGAATSYAASSPAAPTQRPEQQKPLSKRERIKENKKSGVACCPKCGSTSLSANKKGVGIGKAAVGLWAVGPIGIAAGAIGAGKTLVTCLNCGHKWKL